MKYPSFVIKYMILYRNLNTFSSKTFPLFKSSVVGFVKSNGRNNTGHITCYHKGGGHKRSYRVLNSSSNVNAIVVSIEYDPNRSCLVTCLFDFITQTFFYMPACFNCSIGDIIKTGFNAELHQGHVLKLIHIPEGTLVCNVSDGLSYPTLYSKSAGTYSILLEKTKTHCILKLPSGYQKKLRLESVATIGIVSKRPFKSFLSKKAGLSRWLNKRPTVRGVAMNPIDHPHGGGEGKKSGKKYTPWGKSVTKKIKIRYILPE
jgi:large subunit ribosomal protein L2